MLSFIDNNLILLYIQSKGPCINRRKRYYFNKRAGKCEEFVYGGCKGNANNFLSYDACYSKCVKRMYSGGAKNNGKQKISSTTITTTLPSRTHTANSLEEIVCHLPRTKGKTSM